MDPSQYLAIRRASAKPSADGQWLEFNDGTRAPIRPLHPAAEGARRPEESLGLGDALHKVAGPIGRAIKWPCMKGDGTTDLKPNSPCDKVRQALNAVKIQASKGTEQ